MQLWASNMTAPSGPTFSRASFILCRSPLNLQRGPGEILRPARTYFLIALGPGYIQILSRHGPPNSR